MAAFRGLLSIAGLGKEPPHVVKANAYIAAAEKAQESGNADGAVEGYETKLLHTCAHLHHEIADVRARLHGVRVLDRSLQHVHSLRCTVFLALITAHV